MIGLEKRVALITGGGRGLGFSHARLLARLGATVVVNDVDADVAEDAVRAIRAQGGKAIADSHSVEESAGAKAMVEAAIAELAASISWSPMPAI